MSTVEIRVADFSVAPGGRLKTYSLYSGEEFRESVLLPEIRGGNKIRVLLDGVRGYGSSFLEEAFGGLVRKLEWTSERDIADKIELVSEENPSWVEESYEYMRDSLRPVN